MRTADRLLRSGDTWLIVFADDDGDGDGDGEQAARWVEADGRLAATASLQSFVAHCQVSEPWEIVAVDDPSAPTGLRAAIEGDPGNPPS